MTIETAMYISDLNAANPAGTDQKLEGDNHIRLIKAALLAGMQPRSYTPDWRGNFGAMTLGNGSTNGIYFRWGQLTWVQMHLIVGSTTIFPASTLLVSLPTFPAGPDSGLISLDCGIYQTFTAQRWVGRAELNVGIPDPTLALYMHGIAGAVTNINPDSNTICWS